MLLQELLCLLHRFDIWFVSVPSMVEKPVLHSLERDNLRVVAGFLHQVSETRGIFKRNCRVGRTVNDGHGRRSGADMVDRGNLAVPGGELLLAVTSGPGIEDRIEGDHKIRHRVGPVWATFRVMLRVEIKGRLTASELYYMFILRYNRCPTGCAIAKKRAMTVCDLPLKELEVYRPLPTRRAAVCSARYHDRHREPKLWPAEDLMQVGAAD